jgi:hypothetical protein
MRVNWRFTEREQDPKVRSTDPFPQLTLKSNFDKAVANHPRLGTLSYRVRPTVQPSGENYINLRSFSHVAVAACHGAGKKSSVPDASYTSASSVVASSDSLRNFFLEDWRLGCHHWSREEYVTNVAFLNHVPAALVRATRLVQKESVCDP